MLQKLTIQNYAIIDELEIVFSGKLNIITGETGAGKSIIMGALGLILGDRADSSVLVNKERKSVIEGIFDAGGKQEIAGFLQENDFDITDELVIRREIAVNGKSRAFVNDTPVNLAQLNELSSLLVDLHQQFDTLELGESDFQREVLDALAGQGEKLRGYREIFGQWQQVTKAWDALTEQKRQFEKEADYNRFQFNELEEAGFRDHELEDIEAELKLLSNAGAIKGALDKACYELQESESPVVQQLKLLINQLQQAASYPGMETLLQRLQASQIELRDIADELAHLSQQVNDDPQKIEQLQERLSLGYKLQKKHGVGSTQELLLIRKQLEEKLEAVLEIDQQIQEMEKRARVLREEVLQSAAKISQARKKQVKPLEEKVNELLRRVGMPNARMKVDMRSVDPGISGADAIEFLFDANLPAGDKGKGGQFQPIRKVASGGELSRLMLCIKSLVAQSIDLPTLIFDEIDTGISGEAARQVGIILKELASRRQVICITHQPQIAGRADAHFFVYKDIIHDAVKTNIRQLSAEERITAIARMLSGEKPTAAAMENAREMVRN